MPIVVGGFTIYRRKIETRRCANRDESALGSDFKQ